MFGFGPPDGFLLVTSKLCFKLDSSRVSMSLKNDETAWNNFDKRRGSVSVLSKWGRRYAKVTEVKRSKIIVSFFMVPDRLRVSS